MKLKVYVTKIYSIYRMRNGIVAIKCNELYGNELLKNREIYLKQKDYNYVNLSAIQFPRGSRYCTTEGEKINGFVQKR